MVGLLSNKYIRDLLKSITDEEEKNGLISHGYEHAFKVSANCRNLCNLLSFSDSDACAAAMVHGVSYLKEVDSYAKESYKMLKENTDLNDTILDAVLYHRDLEEINSYATAVLAIGNVIDINKERLLKKGFQNKELCDLMQNITQVKITAIDNTMIIAYTASGKTTIKNYSRLYNTLEKAFAYLDCDYDVTLNGDSLVK